MIPFDRTLRGESSEKRARNVHIRYCNLQKPLCSLQEGCASIVATVCLQSAHELWCRRRSGWGHHECLQRFCADRHLVQAVPRVLTHSALLCQLTASSTSNLANSSIVERNSRTCKLWARGYRKVYLYCWIVRSVKKLCCVQSNDWEFTSNNLSSISLDDSCMIICNELNTTSLIWCQLLVPRISHGRSNFLLKHIS